MRLSWMQGEATDFFLAELEYGRPSWVTCVDAADVAVEAAEVEDMGGLGIDFEAGDGFVKVGIGRGVDLGGLRFGEIEEAEGGIV